MDTPFSFETPLESPGFVLWQVSNRWQRHLRDSLSRLELTHVQFVLLAGLMWLEDAGETVTQKRLATHATLDVMMTSEVLRTLEGKGLLERLDHPSDARAKQLKLTALGREKTALAVVEVEAADQSFFAGLEGDLPPFVRQMQSLLEK